MLSLTHVSIAYPSRRSGVAGFFGATSPREVVHDVSFTLGEGETLGLVGESGCGKTTLARAIMGLVPVSSGSIVFDTTAAPPYCPPPGGGCPEGAGGASGPTDQLTNRQTDRHIAPLREGGAPKKGRGEPADRPTDRPTDRQTDRLTTAPAQMVFQDPFSSLNPRLTVLDLLSEAAVVHGLWPKAEREERARALLADVGLPPDILLRYPHAFSGGQRQRLNIARALSLEPRLLVCDEPVSALDVSVQAQVLNLLADLQKKRGLSMLFITHDLAVVRHVAHTIAVMQSGRIVEMGPADKVLNAPQHPYTKTLLAASLD